MLLFRSTASLYINLILISRLAVIKNWIIVFLISSDPVETLNLAQRELLK